MEKSKAGRPKTHRLRLYVVGGSVVLVDSHQKEIRAIADDVSGFMGLNGSEVMATVQMQAGKLHIIKAKSV